MATYQIEWHWFHGSNGANSTIDINIPPAWVGVEISIHGVSGEGIHYAGIKRYRRRLESGADQDIDFDGWPSWPAVIFDHISSVTLGIATGEDQEAWAVARLDYWN